jgi:cytochrome oxidase Cu insertion factor (SCO1/SenC/PrrC family)
MAVPRSPLTRRAWAVAAAVVVVPAVAFAAYAVARDRSSPVALKGDATWKAGARPAPQVRLRDQTGRSFTLAGLHGRTVMVAFLDSKCRTICPIEGHELARVEQLVPAAQRPELVVVSIDPAGDTPQSAARFARLHHLMPGWHWLFGSTDQLRPVWKAFGIDVRFTETDVIHNSIVYLIDRAGDVRAGYLMPMFPRVVASDAEALARA